MISIIIAGRNDNYGGDFEGRLLATARYNLAELARRRVETELVFVEWNPLTDRPLLSERVAAAFDEARCIVVDGAVHRLFSRNRYVAVSEYHAKNVGARRARGDWLLLTNPDNFFGRTILDFLEAGAFDPETLYRAGWIEVDTAAEIDDPGLTDCYAADTPPYYYASGDFMLCTKRLFNSVGGFREDLTFTNTNKDSIFCCAAFEKTGRVMKNGNTYHLRHERDDVERRRLAYVWRRVDRTPQATYGLETGCIATALGPRITRLELTPELLAEANATPPVEPEVPEAYRPRWQGARQGRA